MTTRTLICLACALTLSAAAACASSTSKGAESRPQSTNSNVLTTDEIMKASQPTAYRVIQTVRPQWLLTRRQGSSSGRVETVKVYVQGNRFGEVGALEGLMASTIKEIRHLDARDATTRYGTGHGSGAILVTLR